ncbi:MAG: head GIN domain-containing protein [Cyclobacteriaceae bacterium]
MKTFVHRICVYLSFSLMFVVLLSAISVAGDWREINVSSFNEIYLEGPFHIVLEQGNSSGLQVDTYDENFDKLDIAVTGNRLSIRLDGNYKRKSDAINLRIVVNELEHLAIVGAVKLETHGVLMVRNLKVTFDGAGKVNLNLDANKLITEIAGVGSFDIQGNTDYHKVTFSGIGSYDAMNLISNYTYVVSDGIGSVKVHAAEKFKGYATGIGSVDYYGNPQDVVVEASGIGKVRRH